MNWITARTSLLFFVVASMAIAGSAAAATASTMTGTVRADVLHGASDNDVMRGRAGSDTIRGEGGGDLLHGEQGHDRLLGRLGSDRLDKGPGSNELFDGPGSDSLLAPSHGFDELRLIIERRSRGSGAEGIRGAPALPTTLTAKRVTTVRYGKAVQVAYCFRSMPRDPWKRPWQLHVTLENLRDGLPPLTIPWKVTRRCGTVIQPVAGIKPPYLLRYRVESKRGTWSKRAQMALR